MLIKIIYKNFNIKQYFIYFWGSVLFVTVFFTLISLLYINEGLGLGEGRENFKATFFLCYVLVGIMAILLMNFVFSYYMRIKMKQFGLLLVLGAKKKTLSLMIFAEYLIIYFISCVIGTGVGIVMTQALLWVLKQSHIFVALTLGQYMSIMHITLKITGLIFIFGLAGIGFRLLFKRNLSELLRYDVKKERRYRLVGIVGVTGIGLIIWSFLNLKEYSVWKLLISIVVFLLGMYLFLTFSGGMLLGIYKKLFFRNYIKNILAINEFFYRYKSNKRVIFITFTMHFLVLFFANGIAVSAIIMDEQYVASQYPYDCVMFETTPEPDHTGLLDQVDAKIIEAHKGYWVEDGGYALCISQTSYQQLTGKWIEIAKGEVIVFSQMREASERIGTGISMKEEGKAQFMIREQREDILTGSGQDELAVMTDGEFGFLEKEQMQHIVWGQGPLDEETVRVLEHHPDIQVILKAEQVKAHQRSRVTEIISAVFVALFSSLCCAGILGIKVYSEFENNKGKQEILRNLGITRKQRNQMVSKELRLVMIVPMLGAALLACGFIKADMKAEIDLLWAISFLAFQCICIMIQLLYYCVMRHQLIQNIERYLGKERICN